MKRPASQYYWGDWRRDTALQACSLAARGLWHEMNCLMHDCEPYGHLCVGQTAMQPPQLARLVGITAKECTGLLAELEAAGVFSRTEAGVIYSRRMVRDEDLRERRANGGQAGGEHGQKGGEHGSKGGRPRAKNPPQSFAEGGFETPLDALNKPPPASASATAIQTQDKARASSPTPPPPRRREARALSTAESRTAEQPPTIDAPTPAILACRSVAAAGIEDVKPGSPDLKRLLDAGVTAQELADTAAELVGKGKGRWALLLSTVEGRRIDAAQRGAVPLAPEVPWQDTRKGVEDKGEALGLGRWDEAAFNSSLNAQQSAERGFQAYEARVRKAADALQGSPV